MATIAERLQAAYAAGFRGDALVTITAISLAECGVGSTSGCETGCVPDAAGQSCGVWQIYQPAHPGTATCASNLTCCATLAWAISSHGTRFTPWSTYNSGAYLSHVAAVQQVLAAAALPPPGNLRVTALGSTTAIVAWDAVPGAVSYGVYLDGAKVWVQPQAAGPQAYLQGMVAGSVHSVTVTSWDGSRESAPSAALQLRLGAPPGPPPPGSSSGGLVALAVAAIGGGGLWYARSVLHRDAPDPRQRRARVDGFARTRASRMPADIGERALRRLGETDDWRDAGWLTRDGRFVNLYRGGSDLGYSHDAIREALDVDAYTDAERDNDIPLRDAENAGLVRLVPDGPYLTVQATRPLSPAQMAALRAVSENVEALYISMARGAGDDWHWQEDVYNTAISAPNAVSVSRALRAANEAAVNPRLGGRARDRALDEQAVRRYGLASDVWATAWILPDGRRLAREPGKEHHVIAADLGRHVAQLLNDEGWLRVLVWRDVVSIQSGGQLTPQQRSAVLRLVANVGPERVEITDADDTSMAVAEPAAPITVTKALRDASRWLPPQVNGYPGMSLVAAG